MNHRLQILHSALYQLSLQKQAGLNKYSYDNTLGSLNEQLQKWTEARQVLEEELLSGRPISQMAGMAGTVAKFSVDQLNNIAKYLKSDDETEPEAIKNAEKFEEYLIAEGLINKDSGLIKEAFPSFKELKDYAKGGWAKLSGGWAKLSNFKKALKVLTGVVGIAQVIYGIYNMFAGYRNESNALCNKYGLGHFEVISNPNKIKDLLIKHKDEPDAVIDLIKLASYTRHWLLAFLDAGGGALDVLFEIFEVICLVVTPATLGISAGAATLLVIIEQFNNILQLYAGPKVVEEWFGSVFDSAEVVINEHISSLNKQIKEEEAKPDSQMPPKEKQDGTAESEDVDIESLERNLKALQDLMKAQKSIGGLAGQVKAIL